MTATVHTPPAYVPLVPATPMPTRAAQWVRAGDAIHRPAVRATAIVTSTAPPRHLARSGRRFLTWAVVNPAGRITATGITVTSRGTLITIVPRESLDRRIADQGLLVADLAAKAEDLDIDGSGWRLVDEDLTVTDRADTARGILAGDLDDANQALGRLFALRARIIEAEKRAA